MFVLRLIGHFTLAKFPPLVRAANQTRGASNNKVSASGCGRRKLQRLLRMLDVCLFYN